MPGAFRKLSSFLGLVEDDGYYEEDMVEETPVRENVRDLPVRQSVTPSAVRPVVAPVATPEPEPAARIVTVTPFAFDEAQRIGQEFRTGHAVLMNLLELEEGTRQRITDFAGGLAMAGNGKLERVARGILLLTPANLDVRDMARASLANDVFLNQG